MKNKNVMEKIMQKQRGGNVILILALLAVVAWMPMKAWAVDIPAPQTSAKIHLKAGDGPAFAKLDGWYCSDTDLKKTIRDLQASIAMGSYSGGEREKIERAVTWEFKYLRKGWPFKLAGMKKSPIKKGLDAPPGSSKSYSFKCCYTKDELQVVRDKLQQWLDLVSGGDEIYGKGVDGEIRDWTGFVYDM